MSLIFLLNRVSLVSFFMLIFVSSIHADSRSISDKIKGPLSVLVLGSGAPNAVANGRASSGFLIFVEGQPKVLMDMGGGTFKSLAKSGINIANLDRFLLTHLHLDHSADMSAFIKTVFFHNLRIKRQRKMPFNFYGPATNGIAFPSTINNDANIAQYSDSSEYVDQHYNISHGMERYLHVFSGAINAGSFNYLANDLASDFRSSDIATVFEEQGLVVKSIAVNHGPVPAVAYRIEYKGYSIVWSGDTTSKTSNMIKIANNADILIYDTAIMSDAPPPNTVFHKLHTTPERMAEVVIAANPKKLILSHITPVTEPRLDEVKQIIKTAGFQGKIKFARDLKVYNTAEK